jgi:D-galactarolactone cycloisomerase
VRIRSVESFCLEAPLLKPFGFSRGWVTKRSACLVKITTDDGLVGWGEAGSHNALRPTAAIVQDVLEPLLLGEDPRNIEKLWRKMFAAVRAHGERGMQIEAISGVDIALWDIFGKATGQPVYRLLGGADRLELPAYASGMYYKDLPEAELTDALVDEAVGYAERGFLATKMKIGGLAPEKDFWNVQAVRKALGDGVALIVDANGSYDFPTAVKVANLLSGDGVLWFEEPLVGEDVDGYAALRRKVPIPVSGGENTATRFGVRNLLAHRAVDILQPDICVAGGLTEARKIHAVASTWCIPCLPHAWGTGVSLAATSHFVAALTDSDAGGSATLGDGIPRLEVDLTPNPLREELQIGAQLVNGGRVAVPTGPGLGIDVDDQLVARFSI